MNERLNIQGLIDMLAEKHGMDRKDADGFVKEFFQLIEESLEKDKYVKVKGLGTFRLINVEGHESVNVNTGERFEIQMYTKVSFTPDTTLKKIINRPFSHFETVVLNDATVFEDALSGSEDKEEEEVAPSKPEQPESVKKDAAGVSVVKYFIGIAMLVVLLCGGIVTFMYYPDWRSGAAIKPLAEEISGPDVNKAVIEKTNIPVNKENFLTDIVVPTEVIEPVREDSIVKAVVVAPVPEEVPKEDVSPQYPVSKKKEKRIQTAVSFEPDSVGYTIVGTETTYTIKEGETLTRIALRFYGTKALWPYIVKHNPGVIKNPDNVPYGTTIKIPKLAKK